MLKQQLSKWLERRRRGRYATHVSTGGTITFGSNLMICLNIWIEMMNYDHVSTSTEIWTLISIYYVTLDHRTL